MARNINTIFTQRLLTMMHADVRKAFPQIKNVVAVCSVTKPGRDQWFAEIMVPHVPRFTVDVRACNAFEARYKAWVAFMRKHGAAGEWA